MVLGPDLNSKTKFSKCNLIRTVSIPFVKISFKKLVVNTVLLKTVGESEKNLHYIENQSFEQNGPKLFSENDTVKKINSKMEDALLRNAGIINLLPISTKLNRVK